MKRSIFIAFSILAILSLSLTAQEVSFQGFESPWFENGGTYELIASDGSIDPFSGTTMMHLFGGAYSRFDKYRSVWPGEWNASLAIYIDVDWSSGTGFDYSVASNGSDGNHQRDFIFQIAAYDGTVYVYAGNTSNSAVSSEGYILTLPNVLQLTESGWYILHHRFYEEAGNLQADLSLTNTDYNVLFTETLAAGSEDVMSEIGGNRYAWFIYNTIPLGVNIDDHTLSVASANLYISGVDTGILDFMYKGMILSDWIKKFRSEAVSDEHYIYQVSKLGNRLIRARLISRSEKIILLFLASMDK